MKKETVKKINVFAPGRICLLGEHQDYFNLEVISGAMNLGLNFFAEISEKPVFYIEMPDIQKTETIILDISHEKLLPRDYLRSGLHCMRSKGFTFNQGWRITITGNLPIGKGVSSSSALCVGWIALLSRIADSPVALSRESIARLAFETEVVNFREPGGMQDHIASAVGGLLHINFAAGIDRPVYRELSVPSGGFFLLDTHSKKDTLGMLQSIRNDVANALEALNTSSTDERILQELTLNTVIQSRIKSSGMNRLKATLINRNLTRKYLSGLPDSRFELGRFMNTHHRVLSYLLKTSSEKIDAMCERALKIGASGAKVIGSGGGGCLLIYVASDPDKYLPLLRRTGFTIYPVQISPGVRIEVI